jgi:hypothetical protein
MEMLISRARILLRTGRVKRAFSRFGIPSIVIGERQEVNVRAFAMGGRPRV